MFLCATLILDKFSSSDAVSSGIMHQSAFLIISLNYIVLRLFDTQLEED